MDGFSGSTTLRAVTGSDSRKCVAGDVTTFDARKVDSVYFERSPEDVLDRFIRLCAGCRRLLQMAPLP